MYVVEGGNSGWLMSYQYLSDRGPWNREKLWHPQHEGQPAYIIPPVANIADGPSGLAYYHGTGLSEKYNGTFLLCDFRGGPANSRWVRAWGRREASGARRQAARRPCNRASCRQTCISRPAGPMPVSHPYSRFRSASPLPFNCR